MKLNEKSSELILGSERVNEKSVKANLESGGSVPSIVSAEACGRNNTHLYFSFFPWWPSVCHVPCPPWSLDFSQTEEGGHSIPPSRPELLGFKTIEDCLEFKIYIKIIMAPVIHHVFKTEPLLSSLQH